MKVWVIGGTSGIGAAVALYLRTQGDETFVSGDEYDVRKNIEFAWHNKGPFDAVVYSAGVNRLSWIRDLDPEDAQDIYDVNVVGFMRLLTLVADARTNARCHSVVAISSDAAVRPMRTSIAYCASKAALNMAVQCAARELSPIRVNAVAPGMIDGTEMTKYIDDTVPKIRGWDKDRALDYERSQIPLARRGSTHEVALVVRDVLYGPNYLTGAIIPINGGR